MAARTPALRSTMSAPPRRRRKPPGRRWRSSSIPTRRTASTPTIVPATERMRRRTGGSACSHGSPGTARRSDRRRPGPALLWQGREIGWRGGDETRILAPSPRRPQWARHDGSGQSVTAPGEAMTEESVRKLFDRYERVFKQSLSGDMDMDEVASLYASDFIA